MLDQMSRFVSRFRELEQQEYTQTREEERQWNLLKIKLAAPQVEEQHQTINRKCIAVTSLYEQAGASFVAGNVAYSLASQGIPVTLCEMPGSASYYYFSLDFERRAKTSMKHSSAAVLLMQDNYLRIQIKPPYLHHHTPQIDIADWLLRTNKESSVVVIDLSSRWREAEATRILDFADEIWVIFDTDFARLTRLFLMESAPPWWNLAGHKMMWVANKWNDRLSRSGMKKKVEGTLSLWNTEANCATIHAVLPQFDGEKISLAQAKGSLLLERYPEEETCFHPLVNACKGRML